jgi:hypothetical protein
VGGRRIALVALVAFAVATAGAIALSGSRAAPAQGIAPLVVQAVGYGCALVAALVLMAPADHPGGADRRLGGVVLAAVALLVVLDVEVYAGEAGGANIGAGLVRLVCLLVIVGVAGRLLATSLTADRRRP